MSTDQPTCSFSTRSVLDCMSTDTKLIQQPGEHTDIVEDEQICNEMILFYEFALFVSVVLF